MEEAGPRGCKERPWLLCLWRTLWDAAALVGLVLVLVGARVARSRGSVVRRGFFCDDESIRLPYHDSTVPTWALLLGTIAIPVLSVSTAI